MPGNEAGDRAHNFFGQESVQQGQHNSQVFDGTWPGINNNLWVGSQRQGAGSLVSNFKNYSPQQLAIAESDRGNVQSPGLQHGFNFMQSAQSQNQSVANGYMQGHQAFHTRQNEANLMGMDIASRGISVLDSQMANSSELVRRNSLRPESSESPVNYDFFGSPQSLGAQHPGMLHPLSRQQPGIADVQLLQQHAMLKQMQEFQRQQLKPEFQQYENMRIGSINQASSISKHGGPNLSQVPINGIPIHDAPNHSWQPELMTANMNWMQHGASSAMQVASSGLVSPSDPGQARFMGFVPQQASQSLYGVSVNNSRGNSSSYSAGSDKPSLHPVATSTGFLSSNQFATSTDQVSLPGGNSLTRESKNIFGAAAVQGLHNRATSENLQPLNTQSRNLPMHESYGRLEFTGQPETSQERSEVKANSSQNAAALDPTEEKILFGSDDNIWDIFGKGSNMGAMSDGGDSLGSFPSLQSGSWSALMQSAVAEASRSDIGQRERWSGLSMDNGDPLRQNSLLSIAEDGCRKETAWIDNSLPTSSQVVPSSDNKNMNLNRRNAVGVTRTEVPDSHVENLRQHDIPSRRDMRVIPESQYNLLNNSNLQKLGSGCSQLMENVTHSPDVHLNARSVSGQLQCTAAGSGSQIYKNANGWNFTEPVSNDRNSVLNDHSSESTSQFSGVGNHMHQTQQVANGSGVWKAGSLSDARMPLGNFQSAMENSQVSNEGSNLNNVATATDSLFVRTKVGTQELQRSRNLDLWRDADFTKSSGSGNMLEKERKNHDKFPQVDSSTSNHQGKITNESCELVNSSNKENSSDSFRSNVSHNDTGGMGESESHDGSDRRGAKPKASGHAAKKPSATRKFQYHPMGDLDVDVGAQYNAKHVMPSQIMQQHVSQGLEGYDQRNFGQVKFHSAFGGYKQFEKVSAPGFQSDLKSSDQSKSTTPDHAPMVSAPVSGNMLELLQNVNQSGNSSHPSHTSSSGQQNQPYASQGFNLQLAPPSERTLIADRGQSQSLSHPANASVKNVDSEVRKKGDSWFGEFKNDGNGLQQNNEADFCNAFSSKTPYQGSCIQKQHVSSLNGQVMQNELSSAPRQLSSEMQLSDGPSETVQTDQSRKQSGLHFSGVPNTDHTCKSHPGFAQQSQAGFAGHKFPVLEAMNTSQSSIPPINSQQLAFSKMLPTAWTKVSASEKLSGALPPNDSRSILKLPSQVKADDLNEPTMSARSVKSQGSVRDMQPATAEQVFPENDGGQNTGCASKALCRDSDQVTTQRGIAAFGRSLCPNNSTNQNYSLLHQIQAMRASDADHQNRSMKRVKVADTGLDSHHVEMQSGEQSSFGSNAMVRDAIPSQTSASGLVLHSSNRRDDADSPASFQEKSTFVGNSSANLSSGNFATGINVERPQISPQMAPSWFDQYGTFKNGQMFPSANIPKTNDSKSAEKPSMVVMPTNSSHDLNSMDHVNAAGDIAKLGNLQPNSSSMSAASEHISSHHLGSELSDQNLNLRQKKRKVNMPGLLPWHREVTVGLQRLQTISVAEVDWARAANRLTEKAEDQAHYAEDRQPALRSKRRAVLTTQLMQQLLQAPSRVLSANSREHYESIAYFTARLTLGDACSTVSSCQGDNVGPLESGNMSCENIKSSVRIGDQYMSKAVEDCLTRTKSIDMELSRLEKRAPILDLRLECQELEKFSVINRFAKFHGRGQGDGNGAENPSSSDAGIGIGGQKPLPQRYVAALPMPKNIPDRVQCLSL